MTILQALAALILAAATALGTLADTRLPDQLGGSDSLAAHRGAPVLLVVVDARRLGTVRAWERALSGRYPGLDVVTVADVNEQRPPTLERVSEVLAGRVPVDVRVLIDMERRFATTLGLDTSAPNLIVVDPAGAVVATFHGRHEPGLEGRVVEALAAAGVTP
jgi:hypothetical protein